MGGVSTYTGEVRYYLTSPFRLVLLILAIVFFLVFTLAGFGAASVAHPDGFLGLGLASLAASLL